MSVSVFENIGTRSQITTENNISFKTHIASQGSKKSFCNNFNLIILDSYCYQLSGYSDTRSSVGTCHGPCWQHERRLAVGSWVV